MKKVAVLCLCIISICLTSIITHAQPITAKPADSTFNTRLTNLTFNHIFLEEGLSHSVVTCILKDTRGFMWFGTPGGLNLYNGYTFKIYKPDKGGENGLTSNYVRALAVDKSGILWIGTDRGLTTFDYHKENFRHIPLDESKQDDYKITNITIDHSGNVWVGVFGKGLFSFDAKKNCLTKVPGQHGVSLNDINDIVEGANGDLWIGGDSFSKFDKKNKTFTQYSFYLSGVKEDHYTLINNVVRGDDGTIWFSTFRNGLYRFIPSTEKFTQFDILPEVASLGKKGITDYEMYALEKDEWGNIWIGTNQGLFIFDPATTRSIQYRHNSNHVESLNSNEIISIYYDSSHDLIWLGTLKGGINKCDLLRKEFHHLKFDPDNPNSSEVNNVSAIYEDAKGYLWIGTWSGGLIRYHRNTQDYLRIDAFDKKTDYLPHANIASINEDRYGNIWLSSWRGYVIRIEAKTKYASHLHFTSYNRDQHIHLGFDGWGFRHLYKDKNNDLWIVSYDDGLFKIVNTGLPHEPIRFIRYKPLPGNNTSQDYRCWSMYQDKSGKYWAATEDGLSSFTTKGPKIDSYKHFIYDPNNSQSINHNSARIVYEDSHMNLWIGTGGGGLNKLDRKSMAFSHYTEKDGLPNNMIYGILEDDHGNLWISTENGISKFNPVTKAFRNYDVNDGLQSNEFNIGAYYKNPSTGEMFFGGVNGVTSFFPDKIKSNPYLSQVVITDFKLFNKSVVAGKSVGDRVILEKAVDETEQITLTYHDNAFAFDLIALHYSAPEKNTLAYKLEGFDKDWVYTNHKMGTATYTNLNPGTYYFKVKAGNNDGVWSRDIKNIIVKILPPFWQTLWFRTSFVIAFTGIVLALFRIRITNIKKQKHDLERLVQKRTHEIELQKKKIESQKDQLSQQAEALTLANETLTLKQKELEEQNKKIIFQMDQVRTMAAQLHNADEQKLQFFTNISHEIRTPLTLIAGPLERMIKSGTGQENKQLKLIRHNVKRLSQLVDQVMNICKLETGSLTLQMEKGDIIEFIQKIKDSFCFWAEQKNIRFTFHPSQEHLITYFDADKLEKILSNLLSNAFKFTPEGGEITVRTSILDNAAHNRNSSKLLQLSVSDTGIGIPESHMARIFDRFYQVQHHDVREGMGIGLALVKDLVRLHQGSITASSVPGEGSVFTITLSLQKQIGRNTPSNGYSLYEEENQSMPPEEVKESMPAQNDSVTNHLNAKVLLIVEDNEDIRSFIRESFEISYQVYEAADGIKGFAVAKEIVPDIIISDIMMPAMDGISFCKVIKEEKITCHIPIILLTAKTHDSFRIKGLETGADDYIVKPFNEHVLKLKVQNFIKARQVFQEKFSKELIIKPGDISIDSGNEAFIKKAIHTIEENMTVVTFGVEDFCEAMAVSYIQLYRKLQSLVGQSPTDFIKTIRLQRAAQLLSRKRYSVAEVSDQVGFNDPSYFIRCFKKQFGKTPKDYAATYSYEQA